MSSTLIEAHAAELATTLPALTARVGAERAAVIVDAGLVVGDARAIMSLADVRFWLDELTPEQSPRRRRLALALHALTF